MIPNLRKLVLYEPPFEAHENSANRERLSVLQGHLDFGDIDALFNAWWTVYLGIPQEIAAQIIESPMGATLRPMAQHMPRRSVPTSIGTCPLRRSQPSRLRRSTYWAKRTPQTRSSGHGARSWVTSFRACRAARSPARATLLRSSILDYWPAWCLSSSASRVQQEPFMPPATFVYRECS